MKYSSSNLSVVINTESRKTSKRSYLPIGRLPLFPTVVILSLVCFVSVVVLSRKNQKPKIARVVRSSLLCNSRARSKRSRKLARTGIFGYYVGIPKREREEILSNQRSGWGGRVCPSSFLRMSPQPHKQPTPGTGRRRKKLRRTHTTFCYGNQLKKNKIKLSLSLLIHIKKRNFIPFFFI